MKLFVWRWKGEEKIRTYSMVRLVMGNKPSVPISGVAMSETAKLEDFERRDIRLHIKRLQTKLTLTIYFTPVQH